MAGEQDKLIELLVETLTTRGIEVSTATGDTDGSIVRCGLNKVTSHSSVVVIGEDVDLIVLLTALTPPHRNQAPASERDLNNHRYNSFVKSSTKVKGNLASLPPTQARWGSVRHDGGVLNPVKTTDPIAPHSVRCCATGCGGRCGCRKAGIHCSSICGCDGACMDSAQIRKEGVQKYEDFMDFEDMIEL
ncbi:hypothetical protein PR048_026416 [Dryococelus australis]|uniref:Tesmin/TSO1-like CXC domain-containing protein n=1 Tax=Dryococelus australis TaxID=614101 RepID=A0ABQ9GLA4_9NEOP|nr:hypothetical protein PR048_026416 [Dryococelus australis]